MSTTLVRYAVKADDTIQNIATVQAGDRTKWIDIVALNKLRRPYISGDLADQFGPMLGTIALQSAMNSGDTTIRNLDLGVSGYGSAQSLIGRSNIILFPMHNSSGVITYDAAQVSSVTTAIDPSSGHIVLTATLQPLSSYSSITKTLTAGIGGMLAHPANTVMQVYGSPSLLDTAVAQAGDYITLPVATLNQSGNTLAPTGLIDALGVDIALDQRGQKQVGANGDIKTVSGTDNVKQAIRTRINTTLGELTSHQGYGCEVQKYLGHRQDSSWKSLVLALIHDCILQDPRVVSVGPFDFRQSGDADLITVEIQYNTGGQLITSTIPVTTA